MPEKLLELAADYIELRNAAATNPELISAAEVEAQLGDLSAQFAEELRAFIASA